MLTSSPVLRDPSVSSAPLQKKISFLQSKNLTKEEIDVALHRAGENQLPPGPGAPPAAGFPPPGGYPPIGYNSYGPGGYWPHAHHHEYVSIPRFTYALGVGIVFFLTVNSACNVETGVTGLSWPPSSAVSDMGSMPPQR